MHIYILYLHSRIIKLIWRVLTADKIQYTGIVNFKIKSAEVTKTEQIIKDM